MVLLQKWPFLQLFLLRRYRPGKCLLRYSRTNKRISRLKKQEVQKVETLTFFQKGLTSAFGPKMAIYPNFFFQPIYAWKMSFTILYNKKTPLQAIKTISSKTRNIDIFPNGFTHCLAPKIAIFPTFFIYARQARKMSFTIFYNKKTRFQAKTTRSSKVQILTFFQKGLTHSFGSKITIFKTFFLENIVQKNVFYDILKRKNAFLGYKTKSSKSRKLTFFLRG